MTHSTNRTLWMAGLLVVATAASSAWADVPRLIQFQGKLTLSNGAFMQGPVDLRITLYDQPTGPTNQLFQEDHIDVPLTNGLFHILLGSETLGGIPDSALAATEVYLGASIEGAAELTPRRRVATAPYTVKAKSSEQLVRPDTLSPAVSVDASGRVGVGTTTPDPSALVDMSSTSGGLLPPRMTTAQRNALSNPAAGLMVFNTTTNCLNLWSGVAWTAFGSPESPGTIFGPADVCAASIGVIYSVTDVPGALSYAWTVPPGATLVGGQGSAFATVNFGTTAGNIGVTATNACGTSAGSTLAVAVPPQVPSAPGTISGPGFFASASCSGGQVLQTYSITPVTGATSYAWSVPGDSSIVSGQGTSVITVDFTGSSGGTVSVSAVNGCGNSSPSTLTVIAAPLNTSSPPQTFNATGSGPNGTLQAFTVPCGVTTVTIETWGAESGLGYWSGMPSVGTGKGARMRGAFSVTPGEVLKILVGQRGISQNSGTPGFPGGGGGTFVTRADNTPLIIAGGGGAHRAAMSAPGNWASYMDAVTGTSGVSTTAAGGTNGSGGGAGGGGGGGGGLIGDGMSSSGVGGRSFLNGGQGSAPGNQPTGTGFGGYGGGGGAGWGGAGGGGGYSGGAGDANSDSGIQMLAGGGGSYNAGTDQSNSPGARTGPGQVTISW